MNLTPVESSNIASVGYDNIQNVLLIQFKGKDTVYAYQGVPVEVYNELMSAESIGSYYAKNIKKVYSNEKVEPSHEAT